MRDQYAGDISDVLKFSLLRALAGQDRQLGIAWYYAPGHDGRADGQHVEWRNDDAWRRLDGDVFDALANLPERTVAALEKTLLWPAGSQFHREAMPQAANRLSWAKKKRSTLEQCNVIFLDPDNGLGSDPEKHATFGEVRDLRKAGRAVVFITFPKRQKFDVQVRELHERLKMETDAESVFTIQTSVAVQSKRKPRYFVPRARWFTVVDGGADLLSRAQSFADTLSTLPRVKAKIVLG